MAGESQDELPQPSATRRSLLLRSLTYAPAERPPLSYQPAIIRSPARLFNLGLRLSLWARLRFCGVA
ncbi:hypothetical protein A4R35_12675 [Thermogemmatispora tikiterensis]|uniref:Uncharacterized protein n=1 Tax=Thermogemmatispora tikiterensis TaxID=1825093 RepID=A0A328VLB1_9CHLR|nr:hypothetical protein A4R35_12675 [Thermogemmatispora tikiterensis]